MFTKLKKTKRNNVISVDFNLDDHCFNLANSEVDEMRTPTIPTKGKGKIIQLKDYL